MSWHNTEAPVYIFRILRTIFGIFLTDFGTGEHHKPQNRSKSMLTYQL